MIPELRKYRPEPAQALWGLYNPEGRAMLWASTERIAENKRIIWGEGYTVRLVTLAEKREEQIRQYQEAGKKEKGATLKRHWKHKKG